MADYNAIATDELTSLEDQIDDLKEQIADWEHEKNAILRKGAHQEIEHDGKATHGVRKEQSGRREDEFSRIKLRIDISNHRERYAVVEKGSGGIHPAARCLRREFAKAAAGGGIRRHPNRSAISRWRCWISKTPSTRNSTTCRTTATDRARLRNALEVIEDANIPEYEKKSATERKRWESLFRTQVLSRMQQAIKNVENIISLLNHQLKRPIGHDRYKIDRKTESGFQDLSGTHRPQRPASRGRVVLRQHGRRAERRAGNLPQHSGEKRQQPGSRPPVGLPPVFRLRPARHRHPRSRTASR